MQLLLNEEEPIKSFEAERELGSTRRGMRVFRQVSEDETKSVRGRGYQSRILIGVLRIWGSSLKRESSEGWWA